MREVNEWYEEDGYSANLTVLEKKMKLLVKNFTQVDRRVSIEKKRNSAIEKYFKELNKTLEDAKKTLSKRPWVEEHYNTTFLKEVSVIEAWFAENVEKQSKLKLFDVIVVLKYKKFFTIQFNPCQFLF